MALFLVAACTTTDPLYCDENKTCSDPARPFCDLNGDYPASDGIGRTCIPSPFDAGVDDGGDDGSGSAADAGTDSDAGDASPACRWTTFSRLANVNSSGADYPGSVDDDGLTIHFARVGAGKEDGFYFATRGSAGQAFGEPTLIEELSGEEINGSDPEISSTGLEIFYRLTSGGSIETATRSSPASAFGPSEPTGLNGGNPALSGDGRALYFIRAGQVQRATRTAIGAAWSSPETVLPTADNFSVDVSPDELRILVTGDPFQPAPVMPIAIAERSSTDDEFGAPIPVDPEMLVPDGVAYTNAKWNASRTQMFVSLQLDGATDMYYSVCQ